MDQLIEVEQQESEQKAKTQVEQIKELQNQIVQLQSQSEKEEYATGVMQGLIDANQLFRAEDGTWQIVGQPHVMKEPDDDMPSSQI